MTKGNELAYPLATGALVHGSGLTKRELFAAMAMQIILSSGDVFVTYSMEYIARISCDQADALIAELNKEVQS